MILSVLRVGLVASGASVVVLGACVGSDPGPTPEGASSSSSSGGSSGTTSSSSGVTSSTSSSSGDSGTTCPGGEVVCGGACVDVQKSGAHCGKCNHSCGTAACVAGACQPFAMVSGYTKVHAIDVSASGVVVAADSDVAYCAKAQGCTSTTVSVIAGAVNGLGDMAVEGANVVFKATLAASGATLVQRCAIAGCGTPETIDNISNETLGRIVMGPTKGVWTATNSYYGPRIRKCERPGCTSVADLKSEYSGNWASLPDRETAVPFMHASVGTTKVMWATGGLASGADVQLRYCTIGQSCTTPGDVSRGTYGAVESLFFAVDKHYVAIEETPGATKTVIASTPDALPGSFTPLLIDAKGVSSLWVDSSGIYWSNGVTGKIARCSKLTGCTAAEIEVLATGQTGATSVRADASTVYWIAGANVMAVAK